MSDAVLILNAGSSSLKFALYDAAGAAVLARGLVDHRDGASHLILKQDRVGLDLCAAADAQATALVTAAQAAGLTIVAVGHRIVHGGSEFVGPIRVDARVMGQLKVLVPLAPLHQPHNLAPIDELAAAVPDLVQVAAFDTAFHCTQPAIARQFALPRALSEQGIMRYGFHGLSYDHIAHILPDHLGPIAEARVIVAHLGAGASLCAMAGRKSIATSMGFTALDGLVMATRSGSLDPGVILYLMQARGYSVEEVSDMLYRRSGLLGVSGVSGDMRSLLADGGAEAMAAVDLFAYRAGREIGSLAAALGGLDALVFTGGIGEHSAPVRARICRHVEWLGLDWDEHANAEVKVEEAPLISTPQSAIAALVLGTDEEGVIFRQTLGCLS